MLNESKMLILYHFISVDYLDRMGTYSNPQMECFFSLKSALLPQRIEFSGKFYDWVGNYSVFKLLWINLLNQVKISCLSNMSINLSVAHLYLYLFQ
jgi:hypothetical protein